MRLDIDCICQKAENPVQPCQPYFPTKQTLITLHLMPLTHYPCTCRHPPPSIAPASWPLFWNTASVAFGPLRWRVTLIRPALMMMMMMVMGDGSVDYNHTMPALSDGVPKSYQ